MNETTDFRQKVRSYLKFRKVTSKNGKTAVWVLILLIVVIVLMSWGIPPLHVIPVWGPSMQPTLQVWSLPAQLERFSFSGWVHCDPNKKPEVGNIVYFQVPNTKFREVKRVSEINDLGLLYLQPDNTGVSGEGSDNSELYSWVDPSWVIGVVDSAFTTSRTVRCLTTVGRFRNKITLEISPRDYETDGEFLVVTSKPLVIVSNSGVLVGNYVLAGWERRAPVLYLDQEGEQVAVVDHNKAVPAPTEVARKYREAHYGRASQSYIIEAIVVKESPENVYIQFSGLASRLPETGERTVEVLIGGEKYDGSNRISLNMEGGVVTRIYFSDPEKAPSPGGYHAVLRSLGARG